MLVGFCLGLGALMVIGYCLGLRRLCHVRWAIKYAIHEAPRIIRRLVYLARFWGAQAIHHYGHETGWVIIVSVGFLLGVVGLLLIYFLLTLLASFSFSMSAPFSLRNLLQQRIRFERPPLLAYEGLDMPQYFTALPMFEQDLSAVHAAKGEMMSRAMTLSQKLREAPPDIAPTELVALKGDLQVLKQGANEFMVAQQLIQQKYQYELAKASEYDMRVIESRMKQQERAMEWALTIYVKEVDANQKLIEAIQEDYDAELDDRSRWWLRLLFHWLIVILVIIVAVAMFVQTAACMVVLKAIWDGVCWGFRNSDAFRMVSVLMLLTAWLYILFSTG